MGLFYGGKNISGIKFDTKNISKIHYGGKLVYQNGLAVGTVLLNEDFPLPGDILTLVLPLVSSGWTNINSKIEIKINTTNGKYTNTFSKNDLLAGTKYFMNGMAVINIQAIKDTLVFSNIKITGLTVKSIQLVS